MKVVEGVENHRNYYALYLAIKEGMSPAKAMNEMGIINRKKDLDGQRKRKQELWKKHKEEIVEMRKNGATYREIAEKYKFYEPVTFMQKIKEVM